MTWIQDVIPGMEGYPEPERTEEQKLQDWNAFWAEQGAIAREAMANPPTLRIPLQGLEIGGGFVVFPFMGSRESS